MQHYMATSVSSYTSAGRAAPGPAAAYAGRGAPVISSDYNDCGCRVCYWVALDELGVVGDSSFGNLGFGELFCLSRLEMFLCKLFFTVLTVKNPF